MADRYEEGLRALRDAPAPELWSEVRERASAEAATTPASAAPATTATPLGRMAPAPGGGPGGRFPRSFLRLATVGGALAALLAVVVLARMASSDDVTTTDDRDQVADTPAAPDPPPSTTAPPATTAPPPPPTTATTAEATTTVASPDPSVASGGSTRPRMPPTAPPHAGGPGTVPAPAAPSGPPAPAGCHRAGVELHDPPRGWYGEMQHGWGHDHRIPPAVRHSLLGTFVSDDPSRLAVVASGPSPLAPEGLAPSADTAWGAPMRVGPIDGGWQAEVELPRRDGTCVVTVLVIGADEQRSRDFFDSLALDDH